MRTMQRPASVHVYGNMWTQNMQRLPPPREAPIDEVVPERDSTLPFLCSWSDRYARQNAKVAPCCIAPSLQPPFIDPTNFPWSTIWRPGRIGRRHVRWIPLLSPNLPTSHAFQDRIRTLGHDVNTPRFVRRTLSRSYEAAHWPFHKTRFLRQGEPIHANVPLQLSWDGYDTCGINGQHVYETSRNRPTGLERWISRLYQRLPQEQATPNLYSRSPPNNLCDAT